MRLSGVVLAAASLFFFAACGGDDDGGTEGTGGNGHHSADWGGGCMSHFENGDRMFCVEVPRSLDAMMQASCEQGDGDTERWHSGGCPTSGAVGTCVAEVPTMKTRSFFYEEPDRQRMACEGGGGTWHDL